MDVRRIPLPRADPAADGGRSAAGGACPACHDDSTSPPRAIAGAAAYRWRVRAAAERTPAKPSAAGGRTRTPDWRRVDRRPTRPPRDLRHGPITYLDDNPQCWRRTVGRHRLAAARLRGLTFRPSGFGTGRGAR